MSIGSAVQKGSFVCVYDEKGRPLCSVAAGNGKDDGLKGYTSSTVSIRMGSFILTYNEKGRLVYSKPAR
jgi:hypothetical protein